MVAALGLVGSSVHWHELWAAALTRVSVSENSKSFSLVAEAVCIYEGDGRS